MPVHGEKRERQESRDVPGLCELLHNGRELLHDTIHGDVVLVLAEVSLSLLPSLFQQHTCIWSHSCVDHAYSFEKSQNFNVAEMVDDMVNDMMALRCGSEGAVWGRGDSDGVMGDNWRGRGEGTIGIP